MNPSFRAALLGLLAGAAATAAKTKAEGLLQPSAEKVFPPAPAQKLEIGADAGGHPENMPPSEVADRVQHAFTGDELSDEQRLKAAAPLHWGTGIGFGVVYAVAATRLPAVRIAHGLAAGFALFAGTHGSSLPAAGMQHPPWRMPAAWWIWEGGSHLGYGLVLNETLGLLDRIAPAEG